MGRRFTDSAVNPPATHRQLRISWRQVARIIFGCDRERFANAESGAASGELISRASADRSARALWARGVAVVSAQPMRLTVKGCMIDSKKRKRCTSSVGSAFFTPPIRRAGAQAGQTACFPRKICWARKQATKRNEMRGLGPQLASSWAVFSCSTLAQSLLQRCLRTAKPPLTARPRIALAQPDAIDPRFSLGLARALQVSSSHELPTRQCNWATRRRYERI